MRPNGYKTRMKTSKSSKVFEEEKKKVKKDRDNTENNKIISG